MRNAPATKETIAATRVPSKARGRLSVRRPRFHSRIRNATTPVNPNADRKSTRLNSSHSQISYAVFCLKKKDDYVNYKSFVKSSLRSCLLTPPKPSTGNSNTSSEGKKPTGTTTLTHNIRTNRKSVYRTS